MPVRSFLKKIFLDEEFKDKLRFLKRVALFSDLSMHSLAEVYSIAYEKDYKAGEVIFDEGNVARALYIVQSGDVRVSKNDHELVRFGAGDFFGEMSLLEEIPRSARATAITDCSLLLIYKVKFDGLLEDDPSVGICIIRNLAKMISSRLRQTSESFVVLAKPVSVNEGQ